MLFSAFAALFTVLPLRGFSFWGEVSSENPAIGTAAFLLVELVGTSVFLIVTVILGIGLFQRESQILDNMNSGWFTKIMLVACCFGLQAWLNYDLDGPSTEPARPHPGTITIFFNIMLVFLPIVLGFRLFLSPLKAYAINGSLTTGNTFMWEGLNDFERKVTEAQLATAVARNGGTGHEPSTS